MTTKNLSDNFLHMDYQKFNTPISTPDNPYRWDASAAGIGVPEVFLVGCEQSPAATALPLHHHGPAYEFVFTEQGITSWEVTGARVDTRPGEVLITRPYELHRGLYETIAPSHFWWMVLQDPASCRESPWLGLAGEARDLMADRLAALPRIRMVPTMAMRSLFARIRRSLSSPNENVRLVLWASVLALLLLLVDDPPPAREDRPSLDAWQDVAVRIVADLARHPPVGQIAAELNMSLVHFYRRFRQRFGLSPVAYWNRVRIQAAAERLLIADLSITDVAFEFGYGSSQHFAMAFKKLMGVTPGEWRKRFS